MKHEFYQYIVPLKELIKVGDMFVPDGYDTYYVPVYDTVSSVMTTISDTATKTSVNVITYRKFPMGFLAIVDAIQK